MMGLGVDIWGQRVCDGGSLCCSGMLWGTGAVRVVERWLCVGGSVVGGRVGEPMLRVRYHHRMACDCRVWCVLFDVSASKVVARSAANDRIPCAFPTECSGWKTRKDPRGYPTLGML